MPQILINRLARDRGYRLALATPRDHCFEVGNEFIDRSRAVNQHYKLTDGFVLHRNGSM
jgi:hypothetical protein